MWGVVKSWWSARRLPRAMRRTLRERRSLRGRPWEEGLLHWARDGTLHGFVAPPVDSRRRSTTADGWCPGWALELQRKYLPGTPEEDIDLLP
jgi:hypothetical protein